MTWNGSGTYSPPASSFPEVAGTTIEAARFNNTITDIAAGITAALAKNGENAATANLPMGGYKHTGAAAGTANGEYVVFGTAATLQTVLPAADATYALGSTSYTWTNVFGATFSAGTNKTLVSSSSAESRFGEGSAWTTSAWYANNAARVSIASTGAVTVAAPSSGTNLTLTGAAASTLFGTLLTGSTTGAAYHKITTTGGNYYIGVDNSAGSGLLDTAYSFCLVTESAYPILFGTTNIKRVTIGAAGNVTINAADSGTELTVTGDITATGGTVTATTFSGTLSGSVSNATTVAASGNISSSGGTVSGAALSASGNITSSGGDLIATAGNVTASSGTVSGATVTATNLNVNGTGGNIYSGTWTPTSSDLSAGITTATPRTGFYNRIGDIVNFTIAVEVTPNATSWQSFRLTLPIASDLAYYYDLFGVGSAADNKIIYIACYGHVASDKIDCNFYVSTAAYAEIIFTGHYKVL